MTAAGPTRLRLQPGVAVTPLRAGLHLRGRDGSVTLEGSRALPALWELLLSERLGHGPGDGDGGEGAGERPGRRLELDPADPRVGAALDALTDRLRAQGLLMELPAEAAEPPAWLAASTPRPGPAAEALAAARPVVTAADPEGPLAAALLRALARAGTRPEARRDPALPADRAVAAAGTPPWAVAVAQTPTGGFVTPPTAPERARTDAAAVAASLAGAPVPPTAGRAAGPTADGPDASGARAPDASPGVRRAGGTPPTAPAPAGAASGTATVAGRAGASAALVALLAGAAAQRLLSAVAGLPDPAEREEDPGLLPGPPAVLVAEARPPQASYHPWVTGPGGAAAPSAPPAADLAGALRRIGALGDPYLGVLDAPLPGGLPQLPAALAACRTPAGPLVAGAPRADLARLTAACRAAELGLADGAPGAPVVGAGPAHALGRALRRAALAAEDRSGAGAGAGLPDEEWRGHPQARHWWTVLTRHLGRPAHMAVRRLGAEQAYLAVVRESAPRPGAHGPAGAAVAARAVEATPADAAALAALGAVTRAMAAEHGPAGAAHTAFGGAEAALAAAGTTPAAWADEGWTDRWLAGIAEREPELCAALARLTGLRPRPWRPERAHPAAGAAAAGPGAARVGAALRACGFTVLAGTTGDGR
ncbi:hypothetical protein AB0953_22680 [Streptomyces sp. NPDC046866]|uniref:hypothetical protein n=1 Tax=Streptomyces sp. NPDC046866 TaxID=3154921 RepID=UPI0034571E76